MQDEPFMVAQSCHAENSGTWQGLRNISVLKGTNITPQKSTILMNKILEIKAPKATLSTGSSWIIMNKSIASILDVQRNGNRLGIKLSCRSHAAWDLRSHAAFALFRCLLNGVYPQMAILLKENKIHGIYDIIGLLLYTYI